MSLEFWAGIECTMNRVQDNYFDQFKFNGHVTRIEDLDLLRDLGVKSIRYPIHWERMAPDSPTEQIDWTWAEERLQRLSENQLNPIVGFLHHGSGPRYTNLLDAEFPQKLAYFAKQFATRFPWVRDYTPVNEPLTTARFSTLYGHWYPHKKDHLSFVQALLNQIKGTVLAMQEIRKINPHARLIQTEDLGKTTSSKLLAYQAQFENERRWLSFDLLCGRVTPQHSCWDFFQDVSQSLSQANPSLNLHWFLEHRCPPDIMGINHYVTSNRHLDEKLEHYPEQFHGGNHRHKYADIESIRMAEQKWMGPKILLREAWERFQLPLAITEVHLDSTREEQMRWVKDIWDECQSLNTNGIDIRAVTAWSAFGAYDWNSLVTKASGYYEPGVFDLRSQKPRPTALAKLIRTLALGKTEQDFFHPVLVNKGWWHRPTRVLYGPQSGDASLHLKGSPILIAGANGILGKAFAKICEARAITYKLTTRQEMDIADPHSIEIALKNYKPWAVINAAGYVRVDEAETDTERCFRENTLGPANLAIACEARKILLLTFSSDLVFDGQSSTPYVETDFVAPLNVYGHSKAESEKQVLERHPNSLVVRTSAFFSPWDPYNFITQSLQTLASGKNVQAASDLTVSPTYVPDLVNQSLNLLIDEEKGIWHLANRGAISWADFAMLAAEQADLDPSQVEALSASQLDLKAERPSYSALESEHGQIMPSLTTALDHYFLHKPLILNSSSPYGVKL